MIAIDINEGKKIPFFKGSTGKIALSGSKLTSFLVEIEVNEKIPTHNHPHEQMGVCLDGKAEFECENRSTIIKKGMVYLIKSNEQHSVHNIGKKKAIFLDFFSPPREDYLKKVR